MNKLSFYLGRYSRPLLYLAWIFSLTGLLPNGAYDAFLRPEFGILLVVAVGVLLGFLGVEMGRPPSSSKGTFSDTIRILILAMPLAYLSIGRTVALDSNAFSNRWTGLSAHSSVGLTNETNQADGITEPGIQDADLIGLCWNSGAYEGRIVSVEGVLRHEPEVEQRYGGNGWLLYRFVISCCAADAQPAAVLLTGEMTTNWTKDAWVRATGKFTLRPDSPQPVPVLDLGTLTPIQNPRDPYLY